MVSEPSITANTSTFPYPYPASINFMNFVSIKLNQSNYMLRRTQIFLLIESQDVVGFINGETPQPAREIGSADGKSRIVNPDFTSWVRTDRLVKAWITSTLLQEVLGLVVGLVTLGEVWSTLENSFAQDSQAWEFELLQKLRLIKKGSHSQVDYFRHFKSVCDELTAIGKLVDDKTKVFSLLNGLGSKYESFTTTMLKPPIPTFTKIIPLLQSHELRNKSHYDDVNHSMAFYGHQSTSGGKNYRKKPNPLKQGAEDIPKELASMSISETQDSDWIPDTGATTHMTESGGGRGGGGGGPLRFCPAHPYPRLRTPLSSPSTPPRPRYDFFFPLSDPPPPTLMTTPISASLAFSPFSSFPSPSSFASSAASDDDASPPPSAPRRSLRRRSLGAGGF
uniref:Retrotransposon gag domain-containing protein n=1 Tax=Ananas comosus var. bracteatus TaxID=296719 RepID=A0A6V7Q9L6_ANACO|nr:unnamed protein product [Ananas comosus var. bracteatus]